MTTTTTDDLRALYAAVCAQPEDDTARLAYADALDEQDTVSVPCQGCYGAKRVVGGTSSIVCPTCSGHGTIPDTANADRAAFIRVQVELSRMPPKPRELCVVDGAGTRMEGLGVDLIHEGDGHYTASTGDRALSTETFTPNERVDICANRAGKGIKWMRGLRYVKHVEEREIIVFRRDADSKPWVGAELLAREQALLAANRERWLRVTCPKCGGIGRGKDAAKAKTPQAAMCHACAGSGDIGGLAGLMSVTGGSNWTHATVFHRGFPFSVGGVRLADAFHQTYRDCPACGNRAINCDVCHGHTRIPGDWCPRPWLLRVLRHHGTVERVPLVDVSPQESAQHTEWYRFFTLPSDEPSACVPRPVYDKLASVEKPEPRSLQPYWRTIELANDALAAAVVQVGREWLAKEEK